MGKITIDRTRAAIHLLLAITLLVGALLVAACASSAPTVSSAAPTATPSLPNLQRIHLTNFQASDIVPMAHGMLLLGTPGATGQPHDVPNEFGGHPKGLYYFDFATAAITTLAAIPTTSQETILGEKDAGDWALYTSGIPFDASPTIRSSTLWAVNISTHERIKLDTTATSNNIQTRDIVSYMTDGNIAVWCSWMAEDTAELNLYDFQTHQKRMLLKVVAPFSATHISLDPAGITQGKILYDEFITPFSDQVKSYPQDGLYFLNIATGASQRLFSSAMSGGILGGQFVVWDNREPQSLGLYNIKTNTVEGVWTTACIRPDIAADGSYVACVDYQNQLAMLIQVPSGAQTTLGPTSINARGTIANGRVYWLVPEDHTQFGTEIDIWPLPSR